ncbi:protease Do [Xenophilus sp. AP218F]|nr:protease Do [Xenophilus sp. AP218F]
MSIKKLIVSAMLAASVLAAPAPAALAAQMPDFSNIVESEGRAVVNVSTTATVKETAGLPEGMEGDPFFEFFRRFAPPQPQERQENSLGSGFIISADGYVLTNAHVVARADEITVKLSDKREFKARVIGSDAPSDVALLKIDASNLPVVRLGDVNKLKVGEPVLAIGSPFGFESTATSGIVSAKNRTLPDAEVPFIQTDAAINPGNSGGPLFNGKGEVIGINSQIYSRSGGFMGISFAIPIDTAMDVANQLKTKGKVTRGRIGVVIQGVNQELAKSFGLAKASGALINAVDPKGPAAKAGLKPGDIIVKVGGQAIESPSDLQRLIGNIQPGKPVALEVWRSRASVSLKVVPEELKDEKAASAGREGGKKPGAQSEQSFSQIGLRLQELAPMQLQRAGVKYGLLVRAANGVAVRAGIQPGDIIVGVGGDELTSVAQLKSALEQAKKGGAIALQVMRQGQVQFVPLNIGDAK